MVNEYNSYIPTPWSYSKRNPKPRCKNNQPSYKPKTKINQKPDHVQHQTVNPSLSVRKVPIFSFSDAMNFS